MPPRSVRAASSNLPLLAGKGELPVSVTLTTSRSLTVILLLSSTISLSAAVERPASSVSRDDVLLQAAKAQMTASGIVPGHHLLLHLTNPRIRHPTRREASSFTNFANNQQMLVWFWI